MMLWVSLLTATMHSVKTSFYWPRSKQLGLLAPTASLYVWTQPTTTDVLTNCSISWFRGFSMVFNSRIDELQWPKTSSVESRKRTFSYLPVFERLSPSVLLLHKNKNKKTWMQSGAGCWVEQPDGKEWFSALPSLSLIRQVLCCWWETCDKDVTPYNRPCASWKQLQSPPSCEGCSEHLVPLFKMTHLFFYF